jgi:hypothetical protein
MERKNFLKTFALMAASIERFSRCNKIYHHFSRDGMAGGQHIYTSKFS